MAKVMSANDGPAAHDAEQAAKRRFLLARDAGVI